MFRHASGPDSFKESGLCDKHFSIYVKDPAAQEEALEIGAFEKENQKTN